MKTVWYNILYIHHIRRIYIYIRIDSYVLIIFHVVFEHFRQDGNLRGAVAVSRSRSQSTAWWLCAAFTRSFLVVSGFLLVVTRCPNYQKIKACMLMMHACSYLWYPIFQAFMFRLLQWIWPIPRSQLSLATSSSATKEIERLEEMFKSIKKREVACLEMTGLDHREYDTWLDIFMICL